MDTVDNNRIVVVQCAYCSLWIEKADAVCDEEGNDACTDCLMQCESCDTWSNHVIETNKRWLCDKCYDSCCQCNVELDPESTHTHEYNDEIYCDHCWNSLTFCHDCESALYSSDDIYYCEECGEYYCESCFYEGGHEHLRAFDIHDANYQPSLLFRPPRCSDDTRLYLGVELEIDGAYNAEDLFATLEDLGDGERWFYIKEDSSLSTDGMEIVTHPCTIGIHKKQFPWDKLCKILARSVDEETTRETCGTHIHTSPSFFLDKYTNTRRKYVMLDLELYKLSYLFDKHWTQFYNYSGRRHTSYCKRPNILMEMDTQLNEHGIAKRTKVDSHKDNGKYMAIQRSHHGTFETRLWGGTIKFDQIMSYLEMTNGLMKFVKDHPIKVVEKIKWDDLMSEVCAYDNAEYLKPDLERSGLLCV